MVEHRPEAVDRLVVPLRVLEPFRDRNAQGPRVVRVFCEERPADRRFLARGRMDRRAVQLHELAPLGLPVVDRPDPVDRRLEAREARRVRERGPPLARAGFRRETLVSFFLRVPGLRQGGVHLVAARGAVELRLVVETRGRPEALLEPPSADQRPRSTRLPIQVLDLLRDLDPPLRRILLAQALPKEQVRQRLDSRRPRLGVPRRREWLR